MWPAESRDIYYLILYERSMAPPPRYKRWTCMGAKLLQLYPTLRPLDCSPPGSSVYGILQARILEWVAMPSSRASS